jgi:hypothetical protein
MAARGVVRAIPSVFVGALVLVAAVAQSGPANPLRRILPSLGRAPAPAPITTLASSPFDRNALPAAAQNVSCRTVSASAQSGPPVGDVRVWQPDVVTRNASTLDFAISDGSGIARSVTAEIAYFDPDAPDARLGAYPLRTITVTASGGGEEWLNFALDRPIVVQEVSGTITRTAGLSLRPETPDPIQYPYEPAGPSDYRPAVYDRGPLGFVRLPGPNPVLAHEVCGDAPGDPGLRVLTQMLRSDVVATPTVQLVQTFTCPVTVTAQWVELAIAGAGSGPIEVSIFDLEGALMPSSGPLFVTATVALLDGSALSPPVWGATVPLTITARLEAGHRYALAIDRGNNLNWAFGAAVSPGGNDYPDGELFSRDGLTGPFSQETDQDLSFRVIGVAEVSPPNAPSCDLDALSRAVSVTASFPVPPGARVVQPLTIFGSNFAVGRISWPTHTALPPSFELTAPGSPPDPLRISLRLADTPTYTPCQPPCDWIATEFAVPLVTTAVTGVAEGEGDGLALLWRDHGTNTAEVDFDEASSSGLPPALYDDGQSGFWQPLPGLLPVIAHVMCPATPTAAEPWRAVQQVLRQGVEYAVSSTGTLLQTFRVPVPAEVSWAELGLRGTGELDPTPLAVALLAPGFATGTPVLGSGISLAEAAVGVAIAAGVSLASMRTSEPLTVTLTPGVDYWIVATPTATWNHVAGDASPYAEGQLYRSAAPGLPLSEETDRDLAFRLIGVQRPLMAGPITHTCDPCGGLGLFDAVTVTASFVDNAAIRSFAQVVTINASSGVGRVHLPIGTDGGAVTVTVGLHLTEELPGGFRAPSASTYPLAIATITASAGDMHWSEADLQRAVVLHKWFGDATAGPVGISVSPTADPVIGRAKVALGAGDAVTLAPVIQHQGQGWEPLPGLSLGHVLTPSTRTVEDDLFEMTALHRVDGATLTADVLQTFRVPVATVVRWIELAIPERQGSAPAFEVSIVDPGGLPVPPAVMGSPVSGTPVLFAHHASMELGHTWGATSVASGTVVLLPDRDYWLTARVTGSWNVASAATATAETEGRLYTRPIGDGPWTETPGGLAFRVIGFALNSVDAPPVPHRAGLTLSAEPLPFTRELMLRWSGGTGRMSVEIFDAGGRRVRRVRDAGGAAGGSWLWRGEDDSGRAVGPGVYFARVTLGDGPALLRRVVRLR